MEQKYSYYKKHRNSEYNEFGKKIYNGLDALKNYIFDSYPVVYTDFPDDYSIAYDYKDKSDYIWLVSNDIVVSDVFSWWFRPPKDSTATVFQFPFIYKRSRRVKDWNKVQLVSTSVEDAPVFSKQRVICGVYDPRRGKSSYDMFFLQEKQNLVRWFEFSQKYPQAQLVSSFQEALDSSTTDMLWLIPDDVIVYDTFKFDYEPDEWSFPLAHVFIHGSEDNYNGIALLPKTYCISNRETMYRFYANRKIVDIPASKPELYDVFYADTYDEYLDALSSTTTNMFWIVPNNVKVCDDFSFDLYIPKWDEKFSHAFLNGENYDGVVLVPSDTIITEDQFYQRSFDHKKVDMVVSYPKPYDIVFIDIGNPDAEQKFNSLRSRFPQVKNLGYVEHVLDLFETVEQSVDTTMFWLVTSDLDIDSNFTFEYHVPRWDEKYTHVFLNGKYYDGVALMSVNQEVTQKEFSNRFYVNKKEVPILASSPTEYDIVFVDRGEPSADENYQKLIDRFPHALRFSNINSAVNLYKEVNDSVKTNMFWFVPSDIIVSEFFNFDFQVPKWEENNVHVFLNDQYYDGIALISSTSIMNELEFKERNYAQKKEIPIHASCKQLYDIVFFDQGEDTADESFGRLLERFPLAKRISNVKNISDIYDQTESIVSTSVFWIVPNDVEVSNDFSFNFTIPKWDEKYVHIFRNGDHYDGIALISKDYPISEKEFSRRFYINKKQVDILASTPVKQNYDIVFISYNESNADENYQTLLSKFPNAKRVHGVKGIHQAHIEAAKQVETEMFWVVDADAVIVNGFDFTFQVPHYERDIVHVWWSQNPVNDLIYGYGGVKLLPTKLTLDMDTETPDMTTSISSKFKSVPIVSNITAFNTDAFNTWKSAFRECAKLASGTIARQKSNETLERLTVWTTQSNDQPFSEYALKGALAGKVFGEENKNNLEELKKINDFDWLKTLFDKI